ncbi:MAG: hypothetical protein A4E45_00051 [Methanosaeta sp. PtaB.Bin039]|nr:MAG: hypothetical protein A4E45_00051 [Methanosaeta sp. PtaB.Bin039]
MEDIRATLSNPENRDVTLGIIIEKLDELGNKFMEVCQQNATDHDKIFKRLDEGDQYFVVFRMSRCAFRWLDKNGAVKWGLLVTAFFIADWVSRYLYWDIFPKP